MTQKIKFVPVLSMLSVLTALGACSTSSGVASSATAARTASVDNGVVQLSLEDEVNGNVSDASVGLVAFVAGIDDDRGQMVAAAGIEGTPTVGAEVQSGTVRYDTKYNYAAVRDVSRSSTFISGTTITLINDGSTTLVANFDEGSLVDTGGNLSVDGQINGQNVSGTAQVSYQAGLTVFSPRQTIDTDLNGRIGADGVIATFKGTDATTTIAGGLVGTPE
jgi:hypothetical protein